MPFHPDNLSTSRNFPGRRELLVALFADEVDAICAAAEAMGGGADPGVAFIAWLHRFFAFITSKRPISAELLEHTDRTDPIFATNRDRVVAAAEPLFAAAKQAGEVRGDLALEQVLDMVIAIATMHRDSRYVEPILQAGLDGLRPNQP
jgi:AcrR family transcriptional regulator